MMENYTYGFISRYGVNDDELEENEYHTQCPKCGWNPPEDHGGSIEKCPNCGTRMVGGEEIPKRINYHVPGREGTPTEISVSEFSENEKKVLDYTENRKRVDVMEVAEELDIGYQNAEDILEWLAKKGIFVVEWPDRGNHKFYVRKDESKPFDLGGGE